MKNTAVLALMICILGLLACDISDSDRCVSGQTWDPDKKICQLIPDAAPTIVDTAITKLDSSTDMQLSNIGKTCTKAGNECASFSDATYCLINPSSPSGYCTKQGCDKNCPSGYKCCTCSMLKDNPTCLDDQLVTTLMGASMCSKCE